MNGRRVSLAALLLILIFNAWFRCHTIGPTLRDRFGLRLYPVLTGEAEPLDCDESIYAYIGDRIRAGKVMYRDLTENKPPGGYWLYAMTVAVGGANETAIRLMPLPFVMATIALVWWIAGKIAGPVAAVSSAFVYSLMSTDPYLYGNGANMEHFINLFSTASLAFMIGSWPKQSRRGLFLAGVCVGAASLIKQIAVVHLIVYLIAIAIARAKRLLGRSFWIFRRSPRASSPSAPRRQCFSSFKEQGRRLLRIFSNTGVPWPPTRRATRRRNPSSFAGSREIPTRKGGCPGRSASRRVEPGGRRDRGRSGRPQFRR